MHRWRWALVVAVLVTVLPSAQRQHRLFVLQPPNRFVEYDITTFQERSSAAVPDYVVKHSEYAKVGPTGQILFNLPRDLELGDAPELSGRIWFWDGAAGKTFASRERDVFPSADGKSLVWFANTFVKDVDRDGLERSVRTSARVWRTDLNGGNEVTLASIPAGPACRCTTGTCSESCPEWAMWAPHGVIDAVFVLTRFIPGQLQTSYEQSVAYRRNGTQWQATVLPAPVENILTADDAADMLIVSVPDAGCCGWLNESSDQTLLIQRGHRTVLFDEFPRFGNADYDISFSTTVAALSPGRMLVAHTIRADAIQDELRLSADGKANPAALTKIRAAIADMPLTEIVATGPTPKPVATLRHAEVIGWLSDQELLVAEAGVLTVYDARGTKSRTTLVRVIAAAAFLR